MNVVILVGGLGTRLREETEYKPKPMVEIGGRPILWHIMKIYARYGHTDFILCLGYRGDLIREYFLNYETRNRDVTVVLGSGELKIHNCHPEDGWKVTMVDTGEKTLTGGRLKRVAHYLDGQEFMLTYGDGVANVNLDRLIAFHRQQGRLGTVTAVRPSSRFGELSIEQGLVSVFHEKPQVNQGWINGGFFVFKPSVLDMLSGDHDTLEDHLLAKLSRQRELAVYEHDDFWQCMDTYREMELLNGLWRTGKAPWATWKQTQ